MNQIKKKTKKKTKKQIAKSRQCLPGLVTVLGVLLSGVSVADTSNTSSITRATLNYDQGQITVNDNAFNELNQAMATEMTTQSNHVTQRVMILKSIALRIGQQYGYAKQLQYLQDRITSKAPSLDQVFNFNFILSYANRDSPAINVVPPVILKASDFVQQDNLTSLTIADVHYVIYRNVHFVTTVPSWRDYLVKEIPKPEVVSDSILPKDGFVE